MNTPKLLITLLFCVFPLVAETLILEEIVSKVNGDIILRSEYDAVLSDIRTEVGRDQEIPEAERTKIISERQTHVLRDLIDQRLLVQRGTELGINVEGQVLRQRDAIMKQFELNTVEDFETWIGERTGQSPEDLMSQMRENFLSQGVLAQEVGSRITISREEIEAYYEEHKAEFVRNEGVRLSEILISNAGLTGAELAAAEKRSKEVRDRVHRGEPFAEMARRLSDSEVSKENGGDIGIFRRGDLMKEIEDQVYDKNPGFITELIEVANGWLLLKVEEKFREGQAEMSEVQEEIRNRLMMPKYQPAVREYMTFLRQDAYIEIRPGYTDTSAAPEIDTSWSDPTDLAPITTTRQALIDSTKKKKALWVIPIPGTSPVKKDEDADL